MFHSAIEVIVVNLPKTVAVRNGFLYRPGSNSRARTDRVQTNPTPLVRRADGFVVFSTDASPAAGLRIRSVEGDNPGSPRMGRVSIIVFRTSGECVAVPQRSA